MHSLVLEQAAIDKLKAVESGIEVRDHQGQLIGFFHPAITPAVSINTDVRSAKRNCSEGLATVTAGRCLLSWTT